MSTRTKPGSYTARLHQRTAAAPPKKPQARPWPERIAALLALLAEFGHLAAALAEWPGSPGRGLLHVLVAAGFGLVAVGVYCGLNWAGAAGAALGLVVPVAWLAGAAPYQDFPIAAALALSVVELALTGKETTQMALTRRR